MEWRDDEVALYAKQLRKLIATFDGARDAIKCKILPDNCTPDRSRKPYKQQIVLS